ncbi:MAG: amino acid transporter [Piptocephalis tieghemiana]|nr:MAG: amino acid transporter [Piptocephalis tieghemiana]
MNSFTSKNSSLDVGTDVRKELSSFTNFSVSFSIISVITGICSLYGSGLATGGPIMLVWGWPIVSCFTLMVALSMAEICSAHPKGGGPYAWSRLLAGETYGPLVSWITGWFNLLGQFAIVAGIDFGLAMAIGATYTIFTDPESGLSSWHIYLIYLAILVIHGLLNTFTLRGVALLNNISVWWHIAGVLVIGITLLVASARLQTPEWVFTAWINETGNSVPYTALIGLLMSQFTMTGYDASAQMTEETKKAEVAAPVAIVLSVVVSFVSGWFLILSLTFAIQDYNAILHTSASLPVAQLFLDCIGRPGAMVLLVVVMGAMCFCGNACITSNSRMLYAFAGDKALPASRIIHRIHPTYHTPVVAIWVSVAVAAILGLLSLVSSAAFTAITSLATVCLDIAYVIPIACRLYQASSFSPGPLHLGRGSMPIGIVAFLWVLLTTVGFCLPTSQPVTLDNMNWAGALVGTLVIGIMISWWCGMSRRFTGPTGVE